MAKAATKKATKNTTKAVAEIKMTPDQVNALKGFLGKGRSIAKLAAMRSVLPLEEIPAKYQGMISRIVSHELKDLSPDFSGTDPDSVWSEIVTVANAYQVKRSQRSSGGLKTKISQALVLATLIDLCREKAEENEQGDRVFSPIDGISYKSDPFLGERFEIELDALEVWAAQYEFPIEQSDGSVHMAKFCHRREIDLANYTRKGEKAGLTEKEAKEAATRWLDLHPALPPGSYTNGPAWASGNTSTEKASGNGPGIAMDARGLTVTGEFASIKWRPVTDQDFLAPWIKKPSKLIHKLIMTSKDS